MQDAERNPAPDAPSAAAAQKHLLTRFLSEIGLVALAQAPRDSHLLLAQRFVRLFAYGGTALVLVPYLRAVGNSPTRVGLFMTLTLLGDVGISFVLTLIADRAGRRRLLALGAILMTASGVVFALTGSFPLLLAAAIVGVISPSGNELGPFRAIEESVLAHLTPKESRSDVFAWYNLLGNAGAAFGLLSCGGAVKHLKAGGWDEIATHRAIFAAYSVVGAIKLLLTLCLSNNVELQPAKPVVADEASETAPLLGGTNGSTTTNPVKPDSPRGWLPNISKEGRIIIINLCLLFSIDSFASGLAPLSWITYFFREKFGLADDLLGTLFFATSIIAAGSMLVASSLAKRFGNIKTMVFTHLPSSVALGLLPLPDNLPIAMTLLLGRSMTQGMDSAPRSAFVAAVLLPHERTAAMGLMNVVKSSSQSLSPLITGVLVGKKLFWLAFVLAGSLKVLYDLAILAAFVSYKPREEEEGEPQQNGASHAS